MEEILKEEAAPIRKATTRNFILQVVNEKYIIKKTVECADLFMDKNTE